MDRMVNAISKCTQQLAKWNAFNQMRPRTETAKIRNELKYFLQQSDQEIEDVNISYFSSLFAVSESHSDNVAQVLDCLQPRLAQWSSAFLDAPFTPNEIRRAIFNMAPTKSSGPDKLLALFHHRYWDTIGINVTEASLKFLKEGEHFGSINDTLICLILKVKVAMRITEYQPISLCSVVYKIVAKALDNRLRTVLKEVISVSQSAFIPGRHISDNAVICFECLHAMRSKLQNEGSIGYITVGFLG
ncbi:hypothetical protein Dsin_000932 [Dipteronia sinensis]|uniref:Reverse transcriptase domain-containing protein n=1 Tax=Dipteronia sinensis TaxID=43782 RepID=A0AAE0B3E4_9ROSI|nr:hypothetical protein Dsin_000932 [Dipteronia sinensis]